MAESLGQSRSDREEDPMDIPTPAPQVVVRGEAMLVVDPEIAELGVAVTGRARAIDVTPEDEKSLRRGAE